MKKFRYEIIIFIIDAIGMILELIASRVISPYFGNSNLVWTSVIGIILLSTSLGNYVGGKLADKKDKEKILKIILCLTSAFILLIPIVQKNVLEFTSDLISNTKLGAIMSATILFFISSMLMGAITPIILKLKLQKIEDAGDVSGRITAIGTIGGLFGTFIGGFVLVPNIGSVYMLYILAIITALLIPMVEFKIKNRENIYMIIIIIVAVFLMMISLKSNELNGDEILNGSFNKRVSYDTQYGRVIIYNGILKSTNENVRVLEIDKGAESIAYTDEDKIYELVSQYTQQYDLMFKVNENIQNTLMIGGAGYSYPKYYISHYEDKNMDVVEIDEKITEIAKKYFYLDKLIDDYNLEENKRLQLINDDGRVYLNNTTKKYDSILNDAFSGESPAKTLTTIEAVQKIKEALNDEGSYLTNIISSLEGDNSKFLRAEVNTLKQVFKNVYVIPCNDRNDLDLVQNNMVVATDKDVDGFDEYDLNVADDEIVLTDDYCPVDTLIPQE